MSEAAIVHIYPGAIVGSSSDQIGYPISYPISDELPHGQELSEQLSCQLSYGQAAFDQLSLAKQLSNEQPRLVFPVGRERVEAGAASFLGPISYPISYPISFLSAIVGPSYPTGYPTAKQDPTEGLTWTGGLTSASQIKRCRKHAVSSFRFNGLQGGDDNNQPDSKSCKHSTRRSRSARHSEGHGISVIGI